MLDPWLNIWVPMYVNLNNYLNQVQVQSGGIFLIDLIRIQYGTRAQPPVSQFFIISNNVVCCLLGTVLYYLD